MTYYDLASFSLFKSSIQAYIYSFVIDIVYNKIMITYHTQKRNEKWIESYNTPNDLVFFVSSLFSI